MAWKFNLGLFVLKSGGGLRPAAPLLSCVASARVGGEDGSELRQGRKSKPHSPCRAGPFPSKNRFNKISDEGAKALAEALKVNTALQKLYLIGNEISDAVEQQIKTDERICT